MRNPTGHQRTVKPAKPRPSFPLAIHANGQWYTTRRVGGAKQFFYFGRACDDPRGAAAEAAYLLVASELNAGRFPTTAITEHSSITAANVVDAFLTYGEQRLDAGEIGVREFDDLRLACNIHFLYAVGKNTLIDDLARPRPTHGGQLASPLMKFRSHLDKRMKAHAFNRNVSKVRRMLRWAYRTAKMIREPLHENECLAGKRKRIAKREQRERDLRLGAPIYEPWECVKIVSTAAAIAIAKRSPIMAMTLLAMNSGWGNSQVADVPLKVATDALDTGMVDWIRVKTEEIAQFALWPITAWAIREWLAQRDDLIKRLHRKPGRKIPDLLFITRCGNAFVRETIKRDDAGAILSVNPNDEIAKATDDLQRSIDVKRRGRGFNAFRHTFRTVADDLPDVNAIRRIMGHGFGGMDPHYLRGQFLDGEKRRRLEVVTRYVGHVLLGCVDVCCSVTDKASNAAPEPPAELVVARSRVAV